MDEGLQETGRRCCCHLVLCGARGDACFWCGRHSQLLKAHGLATPKRSGTIVYEGVLDGRPVAVKRLLRQFYDLARKEIQVCARVSHRGIMPLTMDCNWQVLCGSPAAALRGIHRQP